MKLTCPPQLLTDALATVSPVAGKKSVLPILGCVLLRAEQTKVTMIVTNLDLTIELDVPVQVDEPGTCVVPCAKLAAGLAKIGSEEVTLRGTSKALELEGAGNWMKIFAYPPEEFPTAPEMTPAAEFTAPDTFGAVLEGATAFVSDDATRYILNGVLLARQGKDLAIVATDGRRLFRALIEVESAAFVPAVIPASAAKRLASLCSAGEVHLAFSENHLRATGPAWRLATKLIEGNYPNYQQVIPQSGKHRLSVSRAAVMKALPFVNVMVNEATSSPVVLTAHKGGLTLTTCTPDLGEAKAEVSAEVEGGSLKTAFNAKFLSSIFTAMRGDEVTLDIDDEVSPLKVEQAGFVAVLMPMRSA